MLTPLDSDHIARGILYVTGSGLTTLLHELSGARPAAGDDRAANRVAGTIDAKPALTSA